MKVKIKKLYPNAVIPKQATEFSGGWDVIVTEIEHKEDDFVICKLGFALELPIGYKLTLVPRSSLTKTKWILQNSPGLGDTDYRGEYQYRFRALPYKVISDFKYSSLQNRKILNGYMFKYPEFPYKEGERIGQVYLEEIIPIEWEETEVLSDTVRGVGGFGSTDKK